MTRLIDADAINPMRVPQSVKEMRAWIDSQPTVDAVPVRHEHWEHLKHYPNLLFCSGCGDPTPKENARLFYYCPTCGARIHNEIN